MIQFVGYGMDRFKYITPQNPRDTRPTSIANVSAALLSYRSDMSRSAQVHLPKTVPKNKSSNAARFEFHLLTDVKSGEQGGCCGCSTDAEERKGVSLPRISLITEL